MSRINEIIIYIGIRTDRWASERRALYASKIAFNTKDQKAGTDEKKCYMRGGATIKGAITRFHHCIVLY